MMGRFARVGALLAALAVVGSRPTAAAIPNLPAQVSDSTIAAALREAQQLYDENKLDQAARRFDEVLGVAVAAGNRVAERQAHDGRGLVLMEKAEYSAARANFERALELAEGTGDRASVPVTQRHLARLFTLTGEWPRARELWRLALAELESRADLAGQARVLFEMSFDEKQGPAEIERTLSRAEALASQVGDTKLLAGIHHAVGDHAFTRGDFATAIEHLERAIALYESVSATRDLARTLTSLGRLHRAHGHADIALDLYRRALKIQSDVGDEQGVIQSTNAIGVALGALGRSREALEYYGRALTLARRTGSARIVAFQLGNLAGAYIEVGEYDKAVDLLREVLREPQSAYLTSIRENQLSVAYLRLRRYQDAIDAASRSIAAARSEGRLPEMLLALGSRAVASRSMGRPAEALIDYREAMQALEEQRSRLIPTDFMKQGFSTQYQQVFAETIDLLHAIGRDDEALETAEAARARALLDLLASHGVHESSHTSTRAPATGSVELTLRGGRPEGVSSPTSRHSVAIDDLRATARRLQSTLLVYHVGPSATFVWTIDPAGGAVHGAKIAIGADRLRELVTSARPQLAGVPRGDDRSPAALAARGDASVLPISTRKSQLSELYRLLVGPIRSHLPRASGASLTIVPHGPLLLLSFAALIDESGAYLVEKYTLNYAPSAAVLQFTDRQQQAVAGRPVRYLFVADPADPPKNSRGEALPPLPGARREVDAIARRLTSESVTRLSGRDAIETAVRDRLAGATVIHFATHGVAEGGEALDAFVALSAIDGSRPDEDGRLTAAEIYQLDLNADLVVLSACQTLLATDSGDGIAGLARAFLSAGAASVVATLWDVADETTDRLIPAFYRGRAAGAAKARSLRAAQLRLLRDLRGRRVKIDGVTLPEDPFFWAGFVLIGEP